jgi:glycosyltransferase involved in cell wall biosynthesis
VERIGSSKLLVWSTNEAKNQGACQEYRIHVPLNTMFDLFGLESYEATGADPRSDLAAMYHADIIQYYSLGGDPTLHKIKSVNAMKPSLRDGELRVPPAFIYDTDDNTDFVHPFNSTFAHLGVRAYPDAHLLKPGESLLWKDEKGNEQCSWTDMETTSGPFVFDIARNLQFMKVRHEIIRSCDGATVSSPALKSYFENVIGQKNTYVYPNTVVPADWKCRFRTTRENPDEVRIVWQGSMSHIVDWFPLRHAIREVARKYPKVKWVIFGEWFPFVHDTIPDEQVEHHGWVDYSGYKLYRSLLNCDINLCPLVNNAFNRCKSAIKWYEGSILDTPEATLAQNTEPYHEIKDGKTGLLFDTPSDFVEKLSLLIEDAQLRQRLAAGAKQWVLDNRTPEKTTPGLVNFYEEVRREQKHRRTATPLVKPATPQDMQTLARARR